MSWSNATSAEDLQEEKLPRRDWILLPSIALLTVCLIFASTEWIAGKSFNGYSEMDRCHSFTDPVSGLPLVASCAYWEKAPESKPTLYRFNSRGFRSDVEFGPKEAGTFRIVLVGSSVGLGASTQNDETFAALLPKELAKRSGHPVELYNESIPGPPGLPQSVNARFKDVLSTKPDLVLWEVGRWDIKEVLSPMPVPAAPAGEQSPTLQAWHHLSSDITQGDFHWILSDSKDLLRNCVTSLDELFKNSQTAFALQHFLFESPAIYVKYSLSGPDQFAGYLRADYTPAWQARLQAFDADVAAIQAQASAAGVPLAVVLIPSSPQAAMISAGEWPAGYDPYKLGDEVKAVVTSRDAIYLDILPGFRAVPDPLRDYLPVDGHPNAGGHAIISDLLADELSSGVVPALQAGSPTHDVAAGKK